MYLWIMPNGNYVNTDHIVRVRKFDNVVGVWYGERAVDTFDIHIDLASGDTEKIQESTAAERDRKFDKLVGYLHGDSVPFELGIWLDGHVAR